MKNILFFSTNGVWSGSEILWFKSANKFINEGYKVGIITPFDNPEINNLEIPGSSKLNLNNRYIKQNRFKRLVAKIFRKKKQR